MKAEEKWYPILRARLAQKYIRCDFDSHLDGVSRYIRYHSGLGLDESTPTGLEQIMLFIRYFDPTGGEHNPLMVEFYRAMINVLTEIEGEEVVFIARM